MTVHFSQQAAISEVAGIGRRNNIVPQQNM